MHKSSLLIISPVIQSKSLLSRHQKFSRHILNVTMFPVFQFPFVIRKRLIFKGGYNREIIPMPTKLQNQLAEIKVKYSIKNKSADRVIISNSKDAEKAFRSIWSKEIEFREEFIALFLNRANQVIGWYRVSAGGTSGTVVDPKVLFPIALKCMAHGMILCHNHPSGNLKPSGADISLTNKIKKGCELLDMNLLDHLILISEKYFSLADEGVL